MAIVLPHPLASSENQHALFVAYTRDPDFHEQAYLFGYFPWYMPGDPPTWFFTKPRTILKPEAVKISKSMRPYFNQGKYKATFNTDFERVMRLCGEVRKKKEGTWIQEELISTFVNLHKRRKAWSVEVWDTEANLIGGLYGMYLGKIFFGESMFHLKKDASKFALIALCKKLEEEGCMLIDCQMYTPHLERMGAQQMEAKEFWSILAENRKKYLTEISW